MQLPRSIKLPFNYTVKVKHVPYQDLLHKGTEESSYWDGEAQVIYLEQDLSLAEKRYHLLANLFHAVLDLQHFAMDSGLAQPTIPLPKRKP